MCSQILHELDKVFFVFSTLVYKARQTKLQFIVTTRMDFQIFKKFLISDQCTATIWHFGHAPSYTAIEGRGLGDREFKPSVSRTLLLV